MKPKTPIEPRPAKPLPMPVLLAVILCLALVLYLFPQAIDHAFPLALGVVVVIIIVFQMSRSTPAARQRMALILPLLAGLAISWITGQVLFAVLGTIILIAAIVWPILKARAQVPPYLQPALNELQTGNLHQALQLVNQSIQVHPESWQAYQLRSTIHCLRMQILEAEQDARTALKLKPDSFYNYNALGQALLIQGHYAEAREAYAEALQLAPEQATNHYNLGIACYRLGEYSTATEALTKAIQAELPLSQQLWAHYLLGRSLEILNQQDRAKQIYQNMNRYRNGLEKLTDDTHDKPDYPGIVLARADIEGIKRQLSRN